MAAAPLPIRRHGHPHQHHHHHPPICTMTLWIVAVVLVVVLSVGSNSNSSSKRNSNFMGHPHGRAGGVDAWSMGAPSSSSFAGIALRRLHRRPASSLSSSTTASYSNTRALWTMYHSPSDPPHTNNNQFLSNNHNAWTVLSNTERWIQETLDGANRGVGSSSSSSDSIPNNTQRPATAYARKPVSYVCEPPTGSSSSSSSVLVVANLFRHLKEARERGNLHVTTQRASAAQDETYLPRSLRHTLVVILPSAPDIANSFATFDRLVQTINQARRNARDFVVQKTTTITNDDDDEEDDWNVSIHCAHLHPDFQDAPPPPTASALPHQPPPTSLSDIMIHNKEVEYRKLRLVARRSPYPTILIEVKASPSPIDFRNMALTPAAAAPYGQQPAQIQPSSSSSAAVAADIQKLHALFGKTAAVTKDSAATTRESENQDQRVSSSSRDSFWDALGDSIPEVTTATPVSVAQQWMSDHQQSLMIHTSRHGHDAAAAETSNDRSSSSDMTNDAYIAAFTTSETTAVDEAMEFVFTNIAMLQEQCRAADPSFGVIKSSQYDTPMATAAYQQQYLVLPRFLATAATSFEKFGVEVSKIVVCLPNLPVSVAAYHPEHVDAAHRSPVPILALTWNQEHSNMHQDVLQ